MGDGVQRLRIATLRLLSLDAQFVTWEGKCYGDIVHVFGIIVTMCSEAGSSHHVPHLHARYAEFEVSIDFEGNVLEGRFPKNKLSVLQAWVLIHGEELEADWMLLRDGKAAFRIEPLR